MAYLRINVDMACMQCTMLLISLWIVKMCNFHVGRPYHSLIVKFLQCIFIKNLSWVASSNLYID